MDKKLGQRPEVLEQIRKDIAAAEKQRRELRFTYNLNYFGQGNIQVLKNDEFVAELESFLFTLPQEKADEKIKILTNLGEGALAEEIEVRERALALLSPIVKFYLDRNDKKSIVVLVHALCSWLEFETELLPGFAVLNKRFESALQWLQDNACWSEAEEAIILLNRIQTGSLKKTKAIASLTSKTLRNLEKKAVVEKLTDGYLLENDQQQLFRNMLHAIGQKAAVYLLNRVIHSDSRTERLALLDLIPTFGKVAIPALEHCLELDPPWAVVRNIINIIAKQGIDEQFALVERYFCHPDERVQYEMISCVLKLGGQQKIPRLITALGVVRDRLKIYLLRLLVEQAEQSDKVVDALIDLTEKKIIYSHQAGHELLLAIIATLKNYPSEKVAKQLKKMRDEYDGKVDTEQLQLHIDEALKVIQPKIRHDRQNAGKYQDIVSFDSDPVQQQLALEKVRKIEEEVQGFVRAGKLPQAGELIYDQAIAAAKMKDFLVAGLLRDRLLEISPMALAEVIKLGEFIDNQKSTSITSHHLEIWNELYEEMTTEEFNELYYSLRQENYHKGDIIVASGETDTNLYFLNSGFISISCTIGGKEIFLKRMHPSDVLGGDQFFSPSVWTVTLKALSEIQVHVLDHSTFIKIVESYPGIEDKLRRYCQKYSQITELLKMSGDDRREYPRYLAALQTENVLLDPYGKKGKRVFRGELLDISKQGLAFTIRISNSNNARLLLGRHIITTIVHRDEVMPQLIGVIVGVKLFEPIMQDYSVHVKLAKSMEDNLLKKALSFARRIQ